MMDNYTSRLVELKSNREKVKTEEILEVMAQVEQLLKKAFADGYKAGLEAANNK